MSTRRQLIPLLLVLALLEPLAAHGAAYSFVAPPGAGDLKVTMTYPDPPGTPSSRLHRINDLSLKVTSPGGAVYHGNLGLEAATVPRRSHLPHRARPLFAAARSRARTRSAAPDQNRLNRRPAPEEQL